eukprot:6192316-Pleurochrysis_carterae.AAC.4
MSKRKEPSSAGGDRKVLRSDERERMRARTSGLSPGACAIATRARQDARDTQWCGAIESDDKEKALDSSHGWRLDAFHTRMIPQAAQVITWRV